MLIPLQDSLPPAVDDAEEEDGDEDEHLIEDCGYRLEEDDGPMGRGRLPQRRRSETG